MEKLDGGGVIMGSWEDVEARREQAIIKANCIFIKCVKKMSQLKYGKITIKPDPLSPLKKSYGVYEAARFPLHLQVKIKELHKRKYDRNDYYSRYQFVPMVSVSYRIRSRDITEKEFLDVKVWTKLLGRITTRSPKLFIKQVEEFEDEIERTITNTRTEWEIEKNKEATMKATLQSIKGLVVDTNGRYNVGDHEINTGYYGSIIVKPSGAIAMNHVEANVDQFNEITKILGWRKE